MSRFAKTKHEDGAISFVDIECIAVINDHANGVILKNGSRIACSDKERRDIMRAIESSGLRQLGLGQQLVNAILQSAIERYYLPRPLFEDGVPVYIGAEIDDRKRGKLEVSRICYTDAGFYFNNSRDGSCRRKMKGITYAYGERVGRPKQQVLDVDGVPIEVGDTVWTNNIPKGHDRCTVRLLKPFSEMEVTDEPSTHAVLFEEGGWMGNLKVTHREPDSQERIDRDALKNDYEYWGCTGMECRRCPVLVDGKKPSERYGVLWCSDAIRLDLLRRQRELDGRDA